MDIVNIKQKTGKINKIFKRVLSLKKMFIILFIVVIGGSSTNKDLLNTELQEPFNTKAVFVKIVAIQLTVQFSERIDWRKSNDKK